MYWYRYSSSQLVQLTIGDRSDLQNYTAQYFSMDTALFSIFIFVFVAPAGVRGATITVPCTQSTLDSATDAGAWGRY